MKTDWEELKPVKGEVAYDHAVADLKSLMQDADDLVKATAGEVSEKAGAARARLIATLERARKSRHTLSQATAETVRVAARKADTAIRVHPYESIGTAFGIGLLIGVLLVGNRSA
jgi:ElaB/YqjD/DUF883 family membrane-anchored ribosome-binding protein